MGSHSAWLVAALARGLVGCDPDYPEAYPEPAHVAWARAPDARGAGRPAVGADGEVFVRLDARFVSRLDPSSGDETWRTDLDADVCAGCAPGGPLTSDFSWGTSLVVAKDGNVWVVGKTTDGVDNPLVTGTGGRGVGVVLAKLSADDGAIVDGAWLTTDANANVELPNAVSNVWGDAEGLWIVSENTVWRFEFDTKTWSWTARFPEDVAVRSIAATRSGTLWVGGNFDGSATIAGSTFSQPDNEQTCGFCVGPLGSFIAELDPSSGAILRAKQVFPGRGQQFSIRVDAFGDDLAVIAALGQGTTSELCQARFAVQGEIDTVWRDCRPGLVFSAAAAVAPNGNLAVAGSVRLQPDGGLHLGGGPFNSPAGTADMGFGAYYRGKTGDHVWSQRFGADERFEAETIVTNVVVPQGGVLLLSGRFTRETRFSGTTLRAASEGEHAFIVKLRLPRADD